MAAADDKKTSRDYFSPEQLAKRDKDGFSREFRLAPTEIDVDKRTVPLSFSSETPVLRYDMRGGAFYEVLDHASVDMRDMQDGAPLLYGHDRRDHLGTVLRAAVGADKKGRALVKFSRSAFADEKFQDVQDGILTKTSVGYDLSDAEPVVDGEREGIPIIRFRNWRPYEATLCPLPADYSVGVGRAATTAPQPAAPAAPTSSRTMSAESIAATAAAAAPAVVVVDHLARQKEVRAASVVLLQRYPQHAEAITALRDRCCFDTGDDVGTFQRTVLNDILGKGPLAPVRQVSSELGLNNREQAQYSLFRAMRLKAEGKPLDGIELEASRAEAKRLGRDADGFFIPAEVFSFGRRHLQNMDQGRLAMLSAMFGRDMSVADPAQGGYTVQNTVDMSNMVPLLRNASYVLQLGARVLTGLVGDVSIPRVLTGSTIFWVSETGQITGGTPTFGQIAMKPRRIGAVGVLGKQLIAQSSLDVEAFFRETVMADMGVDLDRVAINGKGGAEPMGILQLPAGERATSVTFGAAATWAKVVSFETNVETANALGLAGGEYAYLTTPAARGKWKTTAKAANQAVFLWDNNLVNGYNARSTNQVPSDLAIFGQFSQVLFGEWAGIDMVIDNITLADKFQIKVTIQKLVDMVIRQGKAFAISTDSAAQ